MEISVIGNLQYRLDKGLSTPLDTPPQTDTETNTYIDIFFELSHFRSVTMSGEGSINLPDIIAYHDNINAYGDITEFLDYIIFMDKVYLKYRIDSKPKPKGD